MKKALIILVALVFNLAFVMATPVFTYDLAEHIDEVKKTGDNTFLFRKELSDDHVKTMFDGEVTFQSANYDARDVVFIQFEIDRDKGFKNSVSYYYVFDETVQPNKAERSDPLEVKFLGETLKIIDVISGDELTVSEGTEYFAELDVGDPFSVGGKTLVLENVGEGGSVIVDVDGVKETVGSTPETVNGIVVIVEETHYETTKAQRSAVLLVGELEFPNYGNSDKFKEDTDWKWSIGGLDKKSSTSLIEGGVGDGPYFGIKNNAGWEDADEQDCVELPNDYLEICLEGIDKFFEKDEQGYLLGEARCGNDICEEGEDKENCLDDCKVCVDDDKDGYKSGDCEEDCDDDDKMVRPGMPDLCDGVDNDCDGEVDEGLTLECGKSDVGVCTFGTKACVDGVWNDCDAILPGEELCDRLDNDCDGQVDEGLTLKCGESDVGICALGTKDCSGGAWRSCTAVFPTEEVCGNGLDDDCDGEMDEQCGVVENLIGWLRNLF